MSSPPPKPRAKLPTLEHSYKLELLNLAESEADAPPDVGLDFLTSLHLDRDAQKASFWRSGEEPMPFDAFVWHVARTRLFARQQWVFESCHMMRAADLFSAKRRVHELTLVWGKGCLAGDTLLTCLERSETRTMAEWAALGVPLKLWSWDGSRKVARWCSPVYRKGSAMLYKVTLSDGRSFVGTEDHRCLTPGGWRFVKQMAVGSQVQALPRGIHEGAYPCSHSLPDFATVCEIKETWVSDFYDLTVPETSCYYDDNGILHHNSGKGFCLSLFFAWAGYVLCEMAPDPAEYFGEAPQSGMVGINVAPTADLAKNVFYKYLKRWMKKDVLRPYWQPFLKNRKSQEPLSDEVELYRPENPKLHYPTQEDHYSFLQILSRHSNGAGIDGHNIIIWAADELAAFQKTPERDTGREIHGILRSSAATRYARHWIGLGMSYPREDDDLILQLRKEALEDNDLNGENSTRFTDLAGTALVKPTFSRKDPSVLADYKNDPGGALAKYECAPRSAMDAFIEYPNFIDSSTHEDFIPSVNWRTAPAAGNDGIERIRLYLDSVNREPGTQYFLGGDGGVTKDSYTLSLIGIRNFSSTAGGSTRYLCPSCRERNVAARHEHTWHVVPVRNEHTGEYSGVIVERQEDIPVCVSCQENPPNRPKFEDGKWKLFYQTSDWLTTDSPAEDRFTRSIANYVETRAGKVLVPRLFQTGLMIWRPRLAMRATEKSIAVDLTNVEEIVVQLIEKLGIQHAVFDPWQSIAMVQRLNGVHGCKVETISYSNTDQLRRGKLAKALLYQDNLELMPFKSHDPDLDSETACYDRTDAGLWVPAWSGETLQREEWRKLALTRGKLDHPANGSKDTWDATTSAIWIATQSHHAKLEAIWID